MSARLSGHRSRRRSTNQIRKHAAGWRRLGDLALPLGVVSRTGGSRHLVRRGFALEAGPERERAAEWDLQLIRALGGRLLLTEPRIQPLQVLQGNPGQGRDAPEGGGLVADTGVGIAPADQDAVFEEFRQVGTADKKAEGTGLGLALSRKFIELHGGRIWVTSQVGSSRRCAPRRTTLGWPQPGHR